MASATRDNLLDVFIHLGKPKTITIGFRTEPQATAYHNIISRDPFTADMKLHPTVSGRSVVMRLPSRITDITTAPDWHGYYLCFENKKVAKKWQDALLLWKPQPGNGSWLYIERDIPNRRLCDVLGISDNTVCLVDSERAKSSWRSGLIKGSKSLQRRRPFSRASRA